jgi:hypothetical protein
MSPPTPDCATTIVLHRHGRCRPGVQKSICFLNAILEKKMLYVQVFANAHRPIKFLAFLAHMIQAGHFWLHRPRRLPGKPSSSLSLPFRVSTKIFLARSLLDTDGPFPAAQADPGGARASGLAGSGSDNRRRGRVSGARGGPAHGSEGEAARRGVPRLQGRLHRRP